MPTNMAQRILLAEMVLVGGLALVLLVREMPGVVREVRIWRMASFRAGARHPR
jgi:hypothetical protein